MTVPVLSNRAGETSTTTGTGTITLAGAVSDIFFTFAESGITDGQVVSYLIIDTATEDVEVGFGTYTAAGTTLSRDTVLISKIAGVQGTTKITLSATSEAYIVIPYENIVVADHATGDVDFITGNLTTGGQINIDVDGTAIGADGAVTFGVGSDGAIYSDGTNLLIDAAALIDFRIAGATVGDWDVGGLNLVTGDTFQINGVDVVTSTTLPAALSANAMTSASSLATVGALNSGSITSGFGNIDIGASTFGATGTITGPSGTWTTTGMNLATTDSYFIDGNNVLSQTTLGTTVLSSSLTSVGTIATGTWEGTTVAVDQGGTGATTLTDGGVLLGSGTGAITPMAVLGDGAIVVGDAATDPVAMTAFTSSAGDLLGTKGGSIGQQTIWVPAAAMEPAVTTAPATSNAVEIATSLFAARTMDFATDADDFAYFQVQMPKSWDAGTLVCQFVWSATGTTANTVLWGIAATSLGDDEALTTAFSAPVSPAADTNSTTADDVMISGEVTVTVASTPTAEDLVIFEVSRDVSGDTLAEDARLHGVRIHYTVDTGHDT